MTRDLPVARMTIRGIDKMGYNQRRAIAKWLRTHAKMISAKGAEKRYAGRFTARHY